MKRALIRLFTLASFLVLLPTYGCEMALEPFLMQEEKNTMDWIGQAAASFDQAWGAALKTTEDLDIAVDAQESNQGQGLISGKHGRLEYIRIYVTRVTPKSTRIGIQARTSSFPLTKSGYDRDFAQTIIDRIHKNVRISFYRTPENTNS